MTQPVPLVTPRAVSLKEASRFWFQLGWVSFGGPAGQIALLHRELVDRRRWLSEQRYLHALNYCMLLPGPEAMQLTSRGCHVLAASQASRSATKTGTRGAGGAICTS